MERITLPYRSPQNLRYSKQLFWEPWTNLPEDQRQFIPPFTLNQDKEGFVNFGKEYIRDSDPSGYTTSTRLLGDFGYWDHLLKAGWFRDALAGWDKEIEAKLYAEGLRKLRELAAGDDAKALQAAKFLVNKEFKDGQKPRRGRPSKEEVAGNLEQETQEAARLQEDAARIRLISSK